MTQGLLRGFFLFFATILALGAFAQKRTSEELRQPVTNPTSGPEMFRAYCADCHGMDGKGKGPVATVLTIAPPDLTGLSARNGVKFPEERVAKILSGEVKVTAHGPQDMPIWGPVFGKMGNERRRIKTLTSYLASLQKIR